MLTSRFNSPVISQDEVNECYCLLVHFMLILGDLYSDHLVWDVTLRSIPSAMYYGL
jgi:hypothetical protein